MPYANNKGADQMRNTYTCYIQSFKTLASFCIWAAWFESYLVANLWRHIFPWCGSILTVTIFNHQNVCRKFFLPVLSVSWQLWGICEQLIGLICLIWEGWQIKYKCCGDQTEILTDIHYVCYIYKKKALLSYHYMTHQSLFSCPPFLKKPPY